MKLILIDGTPIPLAETVYLPAQDRMASDLVTLTADEMEALGFVLAPARPDASETYSPEWDVETGSWVMVPRPPPPDPRPATLGRLQFIVLAQTAGGMTDAMLVEAQKNPAFVAFWIKYQMAEAVERDDPITRGSLNALAAGGYMPKGKAVVIATWPTA